MIKNLVKKFTEWLREWVAILIVTGTSPSHWVCVKVNNLCEKLENIFKVYETNEE